MTLASSLGPDPAPPARIGLADALARIASSAREREEPVAPSFPADAFALLRDAGALVWNAVPGEQRPPAAGELGLVRCVAAADGSVGRIYDGHLNAVERLAVNGARQTFGTDWDDLAASRLWAGVWGADPLPGEGPPAEVVETRAGAVLRGVKTFCSGAGGLHRAIVLARAPGAGTAPARLDRPD